MSVEASNFVAIMKQALEKTLEDARRVFANSSRDAGEVIGFFYTAMNIAIAEAEKQKQGESVKYVRDENNVGYMYTQLSQPKAKQLDKPVACGYDETTGNCTQNPCCFTHPYTGQPKDDL